MKIKFIAMGILAACALSLLFYYIEFNKSDKINIICHGTLITQNGLASSRVRVSFFLNRRNGRVNFDGIKNNKNHKSVIIRRASSFTFNHYGNTYIISESRVSELPGNTAPADSLIGMYPSFMLFNDKDYRFNMYQTGDSGYLFMSDKFATLYCVR
ncbi:hypothetical protein RDT67_26150 [Serratia fonticola]|uniref:Uncharacterized protein n=1 Tax=Serratia fonticola TaxID=47917 RepID=A0AAJ1YG28_SERFO|nr:hypothetical protein [Serratia fonticola]MDQ9129888.1 hypothetical protein [Serratia fonticola]